MGEDTSALDKKKAHRERHSGRKAEKKKSKNDPGTKNFEVPDKQRNPKAFAFNSAVRAERKFRRKQDIDTKKQHIPVVDRTPIEPPPILIAVVGPPKVGKTTVINNLIRLFTKSPLTDIKGPVTIVTAKKRRITLVECNNDVNAMIDIAKVADLVLLLCDASFGFEMEIFEFLNICQVHGMPRIMGVLTHLDMIKNAKTLKNTKKLLKHRFWTEVYAGAKLFYLSGIIHGEYLRNEIKNLGRFISVIKFRPLTWRTTHSYLLGDRYEDLTSLELIRKNPKCDRSISLYGYIRGVPLVKNTSVHIAGLGDLKIHDISYLPDPCPLPDVIKKRSLIEKEKLIYAPFSGVGGIVYDKDAVYVELGGSHSHKTNAETNDESKNMVSNIIDTKQTLDVKMQNSEMQIFTGGQKLTAKDWKETKSKPTSKSRSNTLPKNNVDSDLDDELDKLRNDKNYSEMKEEKVVDSGRTRRKVVFDQNDDDFAHTLNMDESESDSDSEDETNKETVYTVLKENKDKDVHDKVASALKYLDKKKGKTIPTSDYEDDEPESDEDENDETDDESIEDESDIPDDISLQSNESLVGVSKMARKEKLVDVMDIDKPSKKRKKKSSKSKDESDEESDEYSFIKDDCYSEGKTSIDSEKKSKSKKEESSDDESSSESEDSDLIVTSKPLKNTDEENNPKDSMDLDSKMETTEISSGSDSEDETNIDIKKENESSSEDSDEEDMAVKWKENLEKKARDAFLDRQRSTQNIMKLVYGVFNKHEIKLDDEPSKEADNEESEDIGGLFHRVTGEQKRLQEEKERMNSTETSLFHTWDQTPRDWLDPENKIMIENCFVTGKWKQSDDASELLKLDDMNDFSDDSEVFGDFEDLETGEKHTAEPSKGKETTDKPEKRKREESESESAPLDRAALIEKKRKLKEKFDSEYDNTENTSFYDDLKTSAEKQAQLNKAVFENMPDDLRVQIEGYRPGMYVRIEFQDVPSEFITNFDPTYPIVIGALNIGEENIGYVNVKIKKHRWYKKILKTSDPLIISLGWRRFQTLPLFSKLEDDMKYRYLKYTPEHITCNAHFWGPITPQGTGFLALQGCDGKLENIKQQGFRIAATGSVQELEKSTQIMKKLKLIGHPLKIYKKTAFIKDMFNSALEVAKFEGARIKTVSGIRGQIKKAVGKPEGSFRATFEDKILLSDIVFCRTWYKVDVPKFYCPVTNLLLPPEQKISWKGARTTGQVKRDKGIKNLPNYDSLYTEIQREPKVFKPLVIPRKLQQELPYRDKPKFAPLKTELKANPEKKRVAVVRSPHEQKVADMLKMLRSSYEHKQAQLKAAMSERVSRHQAEVQAIEAKKQLREKKQKKEIFRAKSKAKIREEKKGGK